MKFPIHSCIACFVAGVIVGMGIINAADHDRVTLAEKQLEEVLAESNKLAEEPECGKVRRYEQACVRRGGTYYPVIHTCTFELGHQEIP